MWQEAQQPAVDGSSAAAVVGSQAAAGVGAGDAAVALVGSSAVGASSAVAVGGSTAAAVNGSSSNVARTPERGKDHVAATPATVPRLYPLFRQRAGTCGGLMPATGSSSAGMESGCPALHLGEDGAVLMGARVRLGGGTG